DSAFLAKGSTPINRLSLSSITLYTLHCTHMSVPFLGRMNPNRGARPGLSYDPIPWTVAFEEECVVKTQAEG
ncbi:hypothetical protein KIPB_007395, partial [Kipferlia bialata]